MPVPTLLFDLDGTLTDPREGIVRCIRHALDGLAKPCPSDDALAEFIGPPLRHTFAVLLENSDGEVIETAVALYRQRFEPTGLYENRVYDGVPEMLRAASETTRAMFVATAKPAVYAERVLRHFGLEQHFAGVYGPELGGRFENKADLIAHLLATECVAAESAIMVGDRANDVLAARANGMRSIGVLWGYGSEAELAEAGADALCASPQDLPSRLSDVSPA